MNTHTIKLKLLTKLTLLLATFTMAAQEAQEPVEPRESPDHSLSLELFGAHNTIGINYDRRFKGKDGLGFRVGLGYGYSERSAFLMEMMAMEIMISPTCATLLAISCLAILVTAYRPIAASSSASA